MEARTSECTNYPALFQGTGWGRLKEGRSSHSHAQIFANRNRFAEQFSLRRNCERRMRGNRYESEAELPHPYSDLMDHMELYVDGDGVYFSVISPYERAKNEPQLRDSYGYYAYPDLYSGGAYTYVKAMPVRKGGRVPPEVVVKLETAMDPDGCIAFIDEPTAMLYFMDGRPPHALSNGETVERLRAQHRLSRVFMKELEDPLPNAYVWRRREPPSSDA